MIEPLYVVLNNRSLAQGLSANAEMDSYCLYEYQPIAKYLWKTYHLLWGFRNYSGSKNKADVGKG